LVREFHEVFGLAHPDHPTPIPPDLAAVRQRLLDEEVGEVSEAAAAVQSDPSPQRLADLARELADVVYVAYGTAISHGFDLDAVIAEVHRANMSKLDDNGRPILDNGKVQKGPNFRPPDVTALFTRDPAPRPRRP
jgi:predicted HAD superfamily Cof-like phosphohydrolase